MAYFLGIEIDSEYKPLQLVDRDNNIIPNRILDIIKFTTSFVSENELMEYLYYTESISNKTGDLVYLIDKGKKGHKTYEPIKMGYRVYLYDAKKYFNSQIILNYLYNHKYDIEFITALFAFYFKKTGVSQKIQATLFMEADSPNRFKEFLESVLKKNINYRLRSVATRILDLINSWDQTNAHASFSKTTYYEYRGYVMDFYNVALTTDANLLLLYHMLENKIGTTNIPVIAKIRDVYNHVNYVNSVGLYNYQHENDDIKDAYRYWNNFFKVAIYIYLPKERKYKKNAYGYVIQERNLVDLGMFIYNYEQYIAKRDEMILYSYNQKDNPDDEHQEEFLEEEDFERYNTTAIDEGYKLRIQDGKRGNRY